MSRVETEVNIDWEQVFEAISDLALIVDSDHRILSANRAVEKTTGLKRREIIGRKCYEIYHDKDHPPSDCPHNKMIASSLPETYEMEMESLGRSYLVTVTPIFSASGQVIQSIHLAKDITAQKKSEENYRLHFMQVNDVIYSIDPEFKVLTVSPSVEKLLGYTPEQLIGRPFHELNVLAPEYFEKAFSDIMSVLSGNKISASLYEFIAKDGTRKIGEVSGAPLILDNKVTAVVSVARDVTDQKKMEARIRHMHKLESIGTLAGGIAHDFNNIIGIILGSAELAMNDVPAGGGGPDEFRNSPQRLFQSKRFGNANTQIFQQNRT